MNMKKLLNSSYGATQVDVSLLVLRVGIGVMMLVHGLPKLEMLFSGDTSQFPSVLGLSSGLSLTLAVMAEVICSVLILVGLGTRLASIPLIITMLVAVFYIHGNDPFANQELGLHYLLGYLVLILLGSGRYSLDAFVTKGKQVELNS